MEILVILFVVFSIVANLSKKKREAEAAAKRRSAQQQSVAQHKAPAVQREDPRFPGQAPAPRQMRMDARFPDVSDTQSQAARRAAPQEKRTQEEQRAMAARRTTEDARLHAPQQKQQLQTIVPSSAQSSISHSMDTSISSSHRRHELEASSITGHAHIESSMEGFVADEYCPPSEGRVAFKPAVAQANVSVPLNGVQWNRSALITGILYSEILGKPKALRGK